MKRLITPRYIDISYRVFLSLVVALFFVHYGSEVNFLDALLIGSFYLSLAGNFFIAFLLISWVHWANRGINKSLSWEKNFSLRILFALFLGFIVPGLIAYFFAALYFYVFGIDIRDTYYRNLIYPVILLLLFVLNVCYSIYYYFSTQNTQLLVPAGLQPDASINIFDIAGSSSDVEREANTNSNRQKEYILANGNNEEMYLNVKEEVCYFYCLNDSCFIKTFDHKAYGIGVSLIKLEAVYSGKDFFRINRNIFLNFKSIHSFTQDKRDRTILVHLKPGLFTGQPEEKIRQFTIPREKVKAFKRWIDR